MYKFAYEITELCKKVVYLHMNMKLEAICHDSRL